MRVNVNKKRGKFLKPRRNAVKMGRNVVKRNVVKRNAVKNLPAVSTWTCSKSSSPLNRSSFLLIKKYPDAMLDQT